MPHNQTSRPGELVCLDTFPGPTMMAGCIGKLKGVGFDWHFTDCHPACAIAVPRVGPAARPALPDGHRPV